MNQLRKKAVAMAVTELSFDRERGGRARLGYRTNTPRMLGVTLRKTF